METTETQITIKTLDGGDSESLRRLAGRDSSDVPGGSLLGASVNGELVAAISLSSGDLIADPFVRTAELGALLEEHARLDGGRIERPRSLPGLRRRQSKAALPASPPGAGGRLLALARRS